MATKSSRYVAYGITLEFPQTCTSVGHGAVVGRDLRAVAAQEYSSIIGYSAADNCNQFRIHWNTNTFYLLFRSDKVFN